MLVVTAGDLLAQDQEVQTEQDSHKSKHSPDSALVQYFTADVRGSYHYYQFSKPLTHFEEFDVSRQNGRFYATLGNTGSASYPLVFNPELSTDFRYRKDYTGIYKISLDSTRIYLSQTPFSHANYMMGTAKEQKLNFELSERLGDGIYVGLHARYANAPGLYLRQRNYYSGATLFGTFLHPSKRYGAILVLLTDKVQHYDNGGIAQPELFFNNAESNRKTMLVKLSEATSREKQTGLLLQQYFSLQKFDIQKDTNTFEKSGKHKFDAGRLVYTFRYSRNGSGYEDNAPVIDFYPTFFNDSTAIYDTVRVNHMEHCFVYSNEEPDTSALAFPFQYSFGLKQQNDRLWINGEQNINNQLVPIGSLKGIIKGKTYFKASGQMVLGGYNSGDHIFSGNFYQFFGKKNYKAFVTMTKSLQKPDYYFSYYNSDNFRWNKSLRQLDMQKIEAGILINGMQVHGIFSRLTGYTFLNSEIKPEQYNKSLIVMQIGVQKEFRLNHIAGSFIGNYQHCTPDSILQLPAITSRLTVCYDDQWFKKVLHIQAGITATYHTKWQQDAYMPALKAFYRQTSFTAGNYPYLDVFANINVKRARLFVKYEHFNAKLMGYKYMIVPDYPQADAAFRFGVSWAFFD